MHSYLLLFPHDQAEILFESLDLECFDEIDFFYFWLICGGHISLVYRIKWVDTLFNGLILFHLNLLMSIFRWICLCICLIESLAYIPGWNYPQIQS